jgi:hypothetical protein
MNRPEGRVDVQIQHSVPDVWVAVLDRTADIGPGIGVEDVQLSSQGEDARQDGRGLLAGKQVNDQGVRPGSKLVAEHFQSVLSPVDQHDPCPFGQHGAGAFEANPRGRTGDSSHFSIQSSGHTRLLIRGHG